MTKADIPIQKQRLIYKDDNPKDAVGQLKPPHSYVPLTVLAEVGLGMFEGGWKYGAHNYRIAPIRSSIYYDAARRHLDAWFEGQDIDPDSGLHHVTKALACLTVLRDSQIQGTVVDDRPPATPDNFWKDIQKLMDDMTERLRRTHPQQKPRFTQKGKDHD